MSTEPTKKLSRDLAEKFREFITEHSPSEVSRHLRSLLLDYMIHQQKTGLPLDFDVYLNELSDLFELLDFASDELEHRNKSR